MLHGPNGVFRLGIGQFGLEYLNSETGKPIVDIGSLPEGGSLEVSDFLRLSQPATPKAKSYHPGFAGGRSSLRRVRKGA